MVGGRWYEEETGSSALFFGNDGIDRKSQRGFLAGFRRFVDHGVAFIRSDGLKQFINLPLNILRVLVTSHGVDNHEHRRLVIHDAILSRRRVGLNELPTTTGGAAIVIV